MAGVVFVDAASLTGYTGDSEDIGGAEASLARVAEGLAAGGLDVAVVVTKLPVDHCSPVGGVRWLGPGRTAWRTVARADVLVVQRRVGAAVPLRLLSPRARLLVWYHDWYFPPGSGAAARAADMLKASIRAAIHEVARATAVVVSHTHAGNVEEHLSRSPLGRSGIRIEVVNNPVVLPEVARDVVVDRDKLIFFSAAWKGLEQVVAAFHRLRQRLPSMHLYVASPGYSAHVSEVSGEHVHHLGFLPHEELFVHVQSALAVFYPADVIPETFGLVFTESHAVGTPVLAHPFGAALEFLGPEELVDAQDDDAISERLAQWRDGRRPVVAADPSLSLESVVERWRQLLGGRR